MKEKAMQSMSTLSSAQIVAGLPHPAYHHTVLSLQKACFCVTTRKTTKSPSNHVASIGMLPNARNTRIDDQIMVDSHHTGPVRDRIDLDIEIGALSCVLHSSICSDKQ